MKTTTYQNKDMGYSVKAFKEGQHMYFRAEDIGDAFGFTENEKYSLLIDEDERGERYMSIRNIMDVCDELRDCNCYSDRVKGFYDWIVHIIKCEEFGTDDYNRVVDDAGYLDINDNDNADTIAAKERLKELGATKAEIEEAIKIERKKLIAEVFEKYGLVM